MVVELQWCGLGHEGPFRAAGWAVSGRSCAAVALLGTPWRQLRGELSQERRFGAGPVSNFVSVIGEMESRSKSRLAPSYGRSTIGWRTPVRSERKVVRLQR